MRSIGSRDFAPIYILMGEESYFIDSLCTLLSESVLTEEERVFGQLTLYGRDCEGGVVVNYARQVPMMGSRQVVIVKEAQQMKGLEKLATYASSPLLSTVLVLCHKEKSIDKRSALYKSALKCGVVLESVRPRDYEIGQWLSAHLSATGLNFSHKALSMLLENLGTDLSKIEGEVNKLLIALPDGTTEITDSDIERYVGISKEFNNYELCNAITSHNMGRALTIADHFSHNPKAYPLLLSVLVIFSRFKEIFTVNYLRWQQRQRGVPFPSDMDLMRLLKMNNSFALSELKQVSARWNNRKVFFILGLLREYDAKSKGVNRGSESDGELLRELILKIFAA